MHEIDDGTLTESLARAAAEATCLDFQSVVSIASALRGCTRASDDPLWGLIAGLEYHLIIDKERRSSGAVFGPIIEAGGDSYPAPLDRIDTIVPGVCSLWERAARLSLLPLVQARFTDLIWEARYGGTPYAFVQLAADAYTRATMDEFGHPLERSEAVQRAIEIASELNDQSRRARAVAAAVELARFSIAAEGPMPGVVLPLLELFVSDRPERRPSMLDEMVDDAVERFGDDPWTLESALELKARLAAAEERPQLRERQVAAFRDLASHSTGLVRYAHLQHAIELADEHGLRSLAEIIRRVVEATPFEELDPTELSATVSISHRGIEDYVDRFVGDDDIESALTRFGAYVPTGDPEENRNYVERLMSAHPLQFLFTRITIGPENSLVRSTQGQDAQAEQALIDHEAQRASMFSLFAVDILDRIAVRYGRLASAASWFTCDLIDSSVAAKIARAIELYEAGDSDSSAAVLASRLERIIRRIAAAVGLTVTRSPDARGRTGGVKGLGELLGTLDGALHEPTRRYLRALLSEVTALNLRNRIGHGLDDEITQREAALLIHAACHLRLLTRGDVA